jgi:hypothetical protein
MKINSCPIAGGANLVSQILTVHFYPSNRTHKPDVVWISLVWSVKTVSVNWAGNDHMFGTWGGYCACAFLLYLNPSAALVFHFSSALSVHDWLIKCGVHLHDSVICMPWDLNIKMNWILSCRVQFPVTRFCLFMEKLLAKRSQVKPCICYIVGKTVFSTFTMALVCLSTSAYPFCAFKLSKTVLFHT